MLLRFTPGFHKPKCNLLFTLTDLRSYFVDNNNLCKLSDRDYVPGKYANYLYMWLAAYVNAEIKCLQWDRDWITEFGVSRQFYLQLFRDNTGMTHLCWLAINQSIVLDK